MSPASLRYGVRFPFSFPPQRSATCVAPRWAMGCHPLTTFGVRKAARLRASQAWSPPHGGRHNVAQREVAQRRNAGSRMKTRQNPERSERVASSEEYPVGVPQGQSLSITQPFMPPASLRYGVRFPFASLPQRSATGVAPRGAMGCHPLTPFGVRKAARLQASRAWSPPHSGRHNIAQREVAQRRNAGSRIETRQNPERSEWVASSEEDPVGVPQGQSLSITQRLMPPAKKLFPCLRGGSKGTRFDLRLSPFAYR